jgi:hypothetical protein
MGLLADIQEGVSRAVLDRLSEDAKERLAALHAASGVWSEADVYDRIRLARFILTGSENESAVQDEVPTLVTGPPAIIEQIRLEKRTQTEDYPFRSGDVLVLGPQIFSSTIDGPAENTVINWRGENFVPQRDQAPLTGVVGPDPAFEAALKASQDREPAPPEDIPEREPAPSSGQHWAGRRGSDR